MGVIYMKLPDELDQQITELALDEKVKKTDLLRGLLEAGMTYRATKEDLALVEKERDVLKERVKDLEKLIKNQVDALAKPVMEDVEKSRVMSCPDPKCGFKTTNPAEYLEHRLPKLGAVVGDQMSSRLQTKIDSMINEKVSNLNERLKTVTQVLMEFYDFYLKRQGLTAKADLEKLDAILRQ